MIYRNKIRSIKGSTETTLETSTISTNALAFSLTTADSFYLGYHQPFTTRYFQMGTVNSNSSANMSVKYWDGSDWTAVEDFIDQTDCFTASGFVGWQNPGGWQKSTQAPVSDLELYWIKITVDANLSGSPTLQSVQNLFCDDSLMKAYYPEIISDTRYLPSGASNFLPQYEAAKNLIVLRLKQAHAITDESEIIDINEVAVAAVHASAKIILSPIAKEDSAAADMLAHAESDLNNELKQITASFDSDNSGTISTAEENKPPTFIIRN